MSFVKSLKLNVCLKKYFHILHVKLRKNLTMYVVNVCTQNHGDRQVVWYHS